VSGRHRVIVAALTLLAVLTGVLVLAFAGNACPEATAAEPCPQAGLNRIVVVAFAALAVGLLVTPFAFLGEFVLRRRIVYLGAWMRAARRGLITALVVAAIAGLRLGGALTVPVAIFVAILGALVEWFSVRRFDQPT
jgi:hypothetical protein